MAGPINFPQILMGQKPPKITIDLEKCTVPFLCKKCLQICPVRVYATRPIEKRDFSIPPKERVDPTKWVILPTWADWCNGCGACVEECPKDAITIQLGDQTIAP